MDEHENRIALDLPERAFFAGVTAAQTVGEQIAGPTGTASAPNMSWTPELAGLFWMMIGARMVTELPDLLEAASSPEDTSEQKLAELQEVFLHGAMTRAPSWLFPAFQLSIPTFEAGPFLDRHGNRVDDEALRRLIAVALQRTWGRIHDGADRGPVYLDSPQDATWVQVGTFAIRDEW